MQKDFVNSIYYYSLLVYPLTKNTVVVYIQVFNIPNQHA